MSGFGLDQYGVGVFGLDTPATAAQASGKIVSSRKFDGVGRVVQTADGTGAFEGMSDTLQRAYVLLKTSRKIVGKILGNYASDERRRVNKALLPLTSARPPLLRIDSVTVDTTRAGSPVTLVSVTDLTRGASQSINASNRFY